MITTYCLHKQSPSIDTDKPHGKLYHKHMQSLFTAIIFVLALLLAKPGLAQNSPSTTPTKPNILLILADDLGIMDLCSYAQRIKSSAFGSCYYETPNIDRLAQTGVSFSRAYTPSLCSPTRASLLSGQYGAKLGINNAPGMKAFKSYSRKGKQPPVNYLPNDGIKRETAPKHRAIIGAVSSSVLMTGMNQDHGQDITSIAEYLSEHDSAFIGKWHLGGGNLKGYRPHNQGFEEIAYHDEGWSEYFNWQQSWHKPGNKHHQEYLTDEITHQTIEWISNRSPDDKPFFLMVSHFAVHGPWQAKEQLVSYFENKPNKGWNDHSNPTYAAQLKSLDDSVGSILQSLEKLGLANNTLIIFMSDNGGVGSKKGEAITSNKPFKGEKATLYEGGIRVPLIITWPGKLAQGDVVNNSVDVTDIYPTIASAAGYNIEAYKKFGDGQSLLPLLKNNEQQSEKYNKPHFFYDPFYRKTPFENKPIEQTPKSAVIQGDYKLIQYHSGQSELYNLEDDPYEQKNIAQLAPHDTNRLRKLLEEWEETIPARYRSKKNPKYVPAKQKKQRPDQLP